MRRWLLALGLLVQLASAASAQPAPAPLEAAALEAFFDGLVPEQLERSGIAGAVVVVVRGDETLFAKGYGVADRSTGRPVTADTLFRTGSISKTATAIAAMRLVEEGRLDLDRPVAEYLDFDLPMPLGPVTLRHLLTHTAGFEDSVKDLLLPPGAAVPSLRDLLAQRVPAQIHAPGSVAAYSNYGITLVGHLIERASGEPFEQHMQRVLLDPLGMRRATFVQPLPAGLASDLAEGHRAGEETPLPFEMIPWTPAGALSAAGTDMARYMSALLTAADGAPFPVGAGTLRAMTSPQHVAHAGMNAGGFAFFEENRGGRRVVGHGGATPIYSTQMSLFLDERVGLYVAFTGHGAAGSEPLRTLDRFAEQFLPTPPLAAAAPGTAADDEPVEGYYTMTRRNLTGRSELLGLLVGQVAVTRNDDGTISASSERTLAGQPRRFAPLGQGVYGEVGGTGRLAFSREADGRRVLHGDFPGFVFREAPFLQRAPVVLGLLGTAVLVMAASLVRWLAGRLRGRREGWAQFPLRLAVVLNLATVAACVWLLAILADVEGLAAFSGANDPWAYALAALAAAAVAASLASPVSAAARWRSVGWAGRAGTTLVAAACLLTAALLVRWNIASFTAWY